MKKLFLLVTILALTVVMSACGFREETLTCTVELEGETYVHVYIYDDETLVEYTVNDTLYENGNVVTIATGPAIMLNIIGTNITLDYEDLIEAAGGIEAYIVILEEEADALGGTCTNTK